MADGWKRAGAIWKGEGGEIEFEEEWGTEVMATPRFSNRC